MRKPSSGEMRERNDGQSSQGKKRGMNFPPSPREPKRISISKEEKERKEKGNSRKVWRKVKEKHSHQSLPLSEAGSATEKDRQETREGWRGLTCPCCLVVSRVPRPDSLWLALEGSLSLLSFPSTKAIEAEEKRGKERRNSG